MAIEAKPSAYPEWNATTGTAGMEEPPQSLKDKGYDDSERPWARHFNWLLNNLFLWVKHLYTALVGSANLALPTGLYIYDPVGGAGTFSLQPTLSGQTLRVTHLHANDRIVVGGVVRDAYTQNAGVWGTSTDLYTKTFTGANAADTYYAYIDADGVLQLSTTDPSADPDNFPICSVDWDGATTLNNLVDLRVSPTFEDPQGAERLLAADPTEALGAATKQYVDGWLPKGVVVPFGGTAAPSGWLLCDGQAVSRATYADLFAVIGTVFGVGDGSTTFNVPDMRSRFPIGKSGTYALGASGGQTTVILGEANLPQHEHAVGYVATTVQTGSGITINQVDTMPGTYVDSGGGAGAAQAFSVLNPYLSLNYIIKT